MINHDQAIFDAIAAATDHNDDGIFVDVQKFIDTFNSHRDRKLCTSLDVAQAPSGLANLCAIVADQPFQNSALSVYEINLILANTGSFMPDEAVMWFRASRGTFGVAQTPCGECHLQDGEVCDICGRSYGLAQTPGRIEALEAALREIDNMAPATCEVTLAHQMADIASAALAPEQDK
jgi:hypothetical protein